MYFQVTDNSFPLQLPSSDLFPLDFSSPTEPGKRRGGGQVCWVVMARAAEMDYFLEEVILLEKEWGGE